MMKINALRTLAIAAILFASSGATLAQELPRAFVDRSVSTTTDYPTGFLVKRPGLVVAGAPGYVPPAKACICTNLGGVSVICPDCDNELSVNLCHTHDRACQDAAQSGGIREHNTFFCTTRSD
jgi:hypothetical protein